MHCAQRRTLPCGAPPDAATHRSIEPFDAGVARLRELFDRLQPVPDDEPAFLCSRPALQVHCERGPLRLGRFDIDPAAVSVHDPLCDIEPESEIPV